MLRAVTAVRTGVVETELFDSCVGVYSCSWLETCGDGRPSPVVACATGRFERGDGVGFDRPRRSRAVTDCQRYNASASITDGR
jgi:hypothetical protein